MWKRLALAGVMILLSSPLYAQQQKQHQCTMMGGQEHGAHGQQAQPGQPGGMAMADMMMDRNLVRVVIADAAKIGLTADQVLRLEPAAQKLDYVNESFRRLHEQRVGMLLTPAAHDSVHASHQETRSVADREALTAVKSILEAGQYVKALELLATTGPGGCVH